ncbi:hypothetical protein PENANT_c030G07662 [Penicillium antarcticum]|uniref:Uncharacterized protein n=1 Tax=Penicillium antarcticum TaxID=416450 RepID=A0A1V6PWI5_9EURO|nr:uncharacterized protein N7508_001499 [Penicillium antarcticum]KAJ5316991.1 hypothetical protein N7508_001499 [Penicillium antarcticum]OQD81077.1 hypothetical protein PENANT_c030G07662 [Penicillium antarcticum]
MADIRSLLRSELASRKGTSQPNTTGNRVTKKRKVDSGDGLMRKKLRAADLDAIQSTSGAASTEQISDDEGSAQVEDVAGPEPPVDGPEDVVEETHFAEETITTAPPQPQAMAIDEDEWAAFEREVAAPSRVPQAPAALAAEATISAAPITTEELAAQQAREKAAATQNRDAELEGEREDAARFMEEEFDEMDQLEERVRILKQKREELRKKRAEDQARDEAMGSASAEQDSAESDNDDDDDDDDEDWDDWRLK